MRIEIHLRMEQFRKMRSKPLSFAPDLSKIFPPGLQQPCKKPKIKNAVWGS
jgi:hypothetical protein